MQQVYTNMRIAKRINFYAHIHLATQALRSLC